MDTTQRDDQNQPNGGAPVVSQQVPQSPQQPDDTGQYGGMPPSVTPHGKEAAPVTTQVGEVADYVEPAAHETAPTIEQSVENAGVQVSQNPENMQVTRDQQAVGIAPAKESTPVVIHDDPGFSTPMSLPQAQQAAKGKPNKGSTWLGNLVVMVFGQQQAKNEHGGH